MIEGQPGLVLTIAKLAYANHLFRDLFFGTRNRNVIFSPGHFAAQ